MDGSNDTRESVDYNCLLPTTADRSLGNFVNLKVIYIDFELGSATHDLCVYFSSL